MKTQATIKAIRFIRKLAIIGLLFIFPSIVKAQTYFRVEQDYPDGSNGQYTANLSSLATYSDAEIQSAFDALSSSGIYFNYPQGQCQNRAEIMHIILQKQLKMQHAKVWLFAPIDLVPNDDHHLEINDPNGYAANNIITWNYHVAPVVLRKNNDNSIDTLVIDPAINKSHAMLLKDWLGSMRNSNVSKYTFLDSKWYFFYTKPNSTIINGFFYPYALHWVEDYHRSTMERGLAANDLAMYLMQKLQSGYADSDGSIKKLLATPDNIYNFFMNPYNNFDTIGTRTKLLENHSFFMREAEQYYWQRVAYWQGEANRLINLP